MSAFVPSAVQPEQYEAARHDDNHRAFSSKPNDATASEDSGVAGLGSLTPSTMNAQQKPMFALSRNGLGHCLISQLSCNRARLEVIHSATPDSPLLPSHSNDQTSGSEPAATFYGRLKQDRPLLAAGLNFAALFALSILILFLILRTLLPPISAEDAPHVKIPVCFHSICIFRC